MSALKQRIVRGDLDPIVIPPNVGMTNTERSTSNKLRPQKVAGFAIAEDAAKAKSQMRKTMICRPLFQRLLRCEACAFLRPLRGLLQSGALCRRGGHPRRQGRIVHRAISWHPETRHSRESGNPFGPFEHGFPRAREMTNVSHARFQDGEYLQSSRGVAAADCPAFAERSNPRRSAFLRLMRAANEQR